jgi:hypothetical protein
MIRFYALEKFKEIHLEGKLRFRYAISNYGRLISFTNRFEDGSFLKGSVTEGYKIFRYKYRDDTGKLKYGHKLFFRMVAENFLDRPSEQHQYVIHIDHNLANDFAGNLKWVTREEMLAHHQTSPRVIDAKKRLVENNLNSNGQKLTITQVMMIKRELANPNRKTRMKMLAKRFGISEMQLYRIKSGENWGHIKI